MARVVLGVTGSVAAVRTAELCAALHAAGHQVQVVATAAAMYFFDPAHLPVGDFTWQQQRWPVLSEAEEWPGRSAGRRYQRGDPVLHIELRRWAQALLIAPLDAHTLAKLAWGLCDNCLCCLWRAWDWTRPVVLAPAMNTLMWEHPFTRQHLQSIGRQLGQCRLSEAGDTLDLIAEINQHSPIVRIVPPVVKTLACGDVGLGGLAEPATIVQALAELLPPT
jgi:phosphopantothenoylcysteine decarboxylase